MKYGSTFNYHLKIQILTKIKIIESKIVIASTEHTQKIEIPEESVFFLGWTV